MDIKSGLGHLWAVIVRKPWPRGIREKNLQKIDSIQLEGGRKGPHAFRSTKVNVSIYK
jgi:hypothetical protein